MKYYYFVSFASNTGKFGSAVVAIGHKVESNNDLVAMTSIIAKETKIKGPSVIYWQLMRIEGEDNTPVIEGHINDLVEKVCAADKLAWKVSEMMDALGIEYPAVAEALKAYKAL